MTTTRDAGDKRNNIGFEKSRWNLEGKFYKQWKLEE
jgi:hypothetical protein